MSVVSLLSDCPKFSLRGKFAMVATDVFANSLAMMRCGSSSDSVVSLILLFTLVSSTLT